ILGLGFVAQDAAGEPEHSFFEAFDEPFKSRAELAGFELLPDVVFFHLSLRRPGRTAGGKAPGIGRASQGRTLYTTAGGLRFQNESTGRSFQGGKSSKASLK